MVAALRRHLALLIVACALASDEQGAAGPRELAELTRAIDELQPVLQNLEQQLQQCHREQLQLLVTEATILLEHASDPAASAVQVPRAVDDFPSWYLWSLACRWGCSPVSGEVAWARAWHAARQAEHPSDIAYEELLVCFHHLQHLRERLQRQLRMAGPPQE